MARNRLEQDFKTQLEERTIRPSADAWQKLEAALDESPKSNRRRNIWMVGIAASLIGVLLFSRLHFNSESQVVPNVVIEEKNDKKAPTQQKALMPETKESLTEASKFVNEEMSKNKPKHSEVKKSAKSALSQNEAKTRVENKQAQETEVSNFEVADPTVSDNSALAILETGKETVTDNYLDSLLRQAEEEIAITKAARQNLKTVDSNRLLESVENDIEQGFREKVFEVVKTGFLKVKTAVAERNQ